MLILKISIKRLIINAKTTPRWNYTKITAINLNNDLVHIFRLTTKTAQ